MEVMPVDHDMMMMMMMINMVVMMMMINMMMMVMMMMMMLAYSDPAHDILCLSNLNDPMYLNMLRTADQQTCGGVPRADHT